MKKKNWLDNALRFEIGFSTPTQINLNQLLSWLDHLEPASSCEITRAYSDADLLGNADLSAEVYLCGCLRLVRTCFELVQIPLFDPPEILRFIRQEGQNGQWKALFSLNLVAHTSPRVCKLVINLCFDLALWCNDKPINDENRLTLYKMIQSRLFSHLEGSVRPGKSTLPVLRAAHAMNIPFLHLGIGIYQLGWGSRSRRLDRSACVGDSALGARMSQNKRATANLLRMAGIPTATQYVFASLEDLLNSADGLNFPLVVKPVDGERGEGVTVNVTDMTLLQNSFCKALKVSSRKQVLVERQVEGICHRVFIANGKLLYAVKRHPMSVVGDGEETIARLVDKQLRVELSKPRWRRSELKPLDALAIECLSRQGFMKDSIPPKGCLVSLRPIESTEWGGVDEDVTDLIHPENCEIALRAAKLLSLEIAGIDIISNAIDQPWFENGAVINEVNFAPLLGGAEISRSYLPKFLSQFIQGDGRIPIEQALSEQDAIVQQDRYKAQGMRCFVTDALQTFDPELRNVHMALNTLNERVNALLLRDDVDALIICGMD